jgi:hypothetical protein
VIVVVELAEVVFETAAYSFLFAVSMEVVKVAEKDIADAARRRRPKKDECTDGYVDCMDSSISKELGNTWNETRCATCRDLCQRTNSWPSQVRMWDRDEPCGRLGPSRLGPN